MCEYGPGPTAPLPGGIGISRLKVYEIEAPDGLGGGTPHVHLACSEGYYVMAGSGAVQTLSPEGFTETPLQAGTVVWFDPEARTPSAMARRDLALEGFAALSVAYNADGSAALEPFYEAAIGIVQPQLPDWRRRWEHGARRLADETGAALDALEAGKAPHLQAAELHQIPAPTEFGRHGMCGRLDVYDVGDRQ